MPQPPKTEQFEVLFSALSTKLLQDVQDTMKAGQEQLRNDAALSLEQHRLLLSNQEASLTQIISQSFCQAPKAPEFRTESKGTGLTVSTAATSTDVPESVPATATDGTATATNATVAEAGCVAVACPVEPTSPKSKKSSDAGITEAGITGRGSTWIAGQDRATFSHKKKKNLHHTTGICAKIVDSSWFHALAMVMICFNAVYIGVDADWNKAATLYSAAWGFQFCEQLFCTFFACETVLRLGAFKRKRDCLHDKWVCLDIFTVTLMVLETWIYPNVLVLFDADVDPQTGPIGGVGRLLRLTRLSRITKLFEMFPELVTMVKGMVAGIRSVHAALFILLLLVYVFAIVMNDILRTEESLEDLFGSVRDSMVTLVLDGVLLDNVGNVTRQIIETGNVLGIICLFCFVLLSALTVMNMVIGVLCQVVIDVSADEKENYAKEQMEKTLYVMLRELDSDNSGELSKEEVHSVIKSPEALAIMNDINVDTQYLLDVSEMLFQNPDAVLPISIFMNIVLTLRGARNPTLNDMAKNHNLMMWAIESELAHHRELMTDVIARSEEASGQVRSTIMKELDQLLQASGLNNNT